MPIQFLLEKIIFRPVKISADYLFHFDSNFEEINFYPESDVEINALHFKVKNPKGIILYFHGNKDNLARWGKISSQLTKFDYDVIAIDYRGYGKSTGTLSEETFFSDALFCYTQIRETLNPLKIVVYGRSLGTGVASHLAGKVNPDKLILETPYYDMHDLISNYFPSFLFKNKLNFKLKSHSYLINTQFPILILHGTKDTVVPYSSGQKLFESLQNPLKKLITFNGGKHNNLNSFQNYWDELREFLE